VLFRELRESIWLNSSENEPNETIAILLQLKTTSSRTQAGHVSVPPFLRQQQRNEGFLLASLLPL
jgi:hypothetical protein